MYFALTYQFLSYAQVIL